MNSRELTKKQAAAVSNQLAAQLAYLGKLKARMETLGFPINDPLYADVVTAYDALYSARVKTHYLGCAGGVGEPPKS